MNRTKTTPSYFVRIVSISLSSLCVAGICVPILLAWRGRESVFPTTVQKHCSTDSSFRSLCLNDTSRFFGSTLSKISPYYNSTVFDLVSPICSSLVNGKTYERSQHREIKFILTIKSCGGELVGPPDEEQGFTCPVLAVLSFIDWTGSSTAKIHYVFGVLYLVLAEDNNLIFGWK